MLAIVRHLRATTNKRTTNTELSTKKFLWYLTECFTASRKGGEVIIKKTRPHPVIQVGAISSFVMSRNRYASGSLGLPLGLWLFACQAHIDVKHVLCRLFRVDLPFTAIFGIFGYEIPTVEAPGPIPESYPSDEEDELEYMPGSEMPEERLDVDVSTDKDFEVPPAVFDDLAAPCPTMAF
ncbi:hypothetical protein B0H13DRAFT_2352162 [Mycena leptocephala]|nr:hypothetical protein B0H13DRAFT_2352162 [Mycena leptocephala]